MDVDSTLYPNFTDLFRVGWRSVEVDLGSRHYRVTVYENLLARDPPAFFAHYDETVEAEIDHEGRRLWVEANLPPEGAASVAECMRAALARLNDTGGSSVAKLSRAPST